MSTFEKLESLNAQIDIWIDEEEYYKVVDSLPLTEPLKSLVESCFDHPNYTHDKDLTWQSILSHDHSLPIEGAHPNGQRGEVIPLDEGWPRFFYAKLLRARIKEKGTDCYSRRLDEVVAYLEKHIPDVNVEDEDTAKLAVFYLLELSAASLSFEMLGFAERAHRIMRERPVMFGKHEENFLWFYELLAKYNMGVGYFHKGRYRKAIVEFNHIIKQVQEEERKQQKVNTKLDFFRTRHGYHLLYLPAVSYRADVQLKLQLAYHALDTLDKYLRSPGEISTYKEIRAEMIKAEACRQMNILGDTESWNHLTYTYNTLVDLEKPTDSQSASVSRLEKLEKWTDFKVPDLLFDGQRQSIKGRLLDIYVQDHLEWLEQSSLIQTNEQDGEQKLCSEMLRDTFVSKYFNMVRYHARSRNGYYQQLTKLLEWLVSTEKQELVKLADELYEKRGKLMLDGPDKPECVFCDGQGADFKRIMNPEHYSWLKDSTLNFFKDRQKSPDSNKEPEKSMENELKNFVRAFLEQEHNGVDLRINDLNLRYKLERDRLKGGLKLCRGDNRRDRHRMKFAFGQLLYRPGKESDPEGLNSEDYGQTMNRWDSEFLGHLQSKSNHNEHKHGLYLIGLQRWNSSSPAQGRSVGGGYLLYHTNDKGTVDLGIAIDPGFDFVRNLFHMGFSISDIDIVLISHSHVDHVRDFESIVQLLTDLKDKSKNKGKKCVHVILSLGVYERLKHIIEDPFYRYHVEPYIIDARREIEPGYFEELESGKPLRFVELCTKDRRHQSGVMRYAAELPSLEQARPARDDGGIKITIQPTRAYHTDPSHYSDSFGFLLKVTERIKPSKETPNPPDWRTVTLGYTGDTKWVYPIVPDPIKNERPERKIWDVSEQYTDCDAVIVHLGSLVGTDEEGIRDEFMNCEDCKKELPECRNLVCEKDHPYLVGLLRMLSALHSKAKDRHQNQLVLVSEFGEELRGGIRSDLIQRLRDYYKGTLNFLPVDVGMDVQLWSGVKVEAVGSIPSDMQKVWCIQCERFVDIDHAEFEHYGVDEALFCVCRTCRKATPLNVLQDRLRQLYEVGRELRTFDE